MNEQVLDQWIFVFLFWEKVNDDDEYFCLSFPSMSCDELVTLLTHFVDHRLCSWQGKRSDGSVDDGKTPGLLLLLLLNPS